MVIFDSEGRTDDSFKLIHHLANTLDQIYSIGRSLLYSSQYKKNPCLPFCGIISIFIPYSLYQPIVFAFVSRDITTKIQYWEIQKPSDNKIEDIDDTPCSAIAIIKRVYALELVMNNSHFDQWVKLTQFVIIGKLFEIGHTPHNFCSVLWRSIYNSPIAATLKPGTWCCAKSGIILFQYLLNVLNIIERKNVFGSLPCGSPH